MRNLLQGFKRPKRAAVLGCGPAGLFATHALVQNGWNVNVYSKRRRSEMFGAQYLHAPIPGLTDGTEPITIEYRLEGTVDGYRDKVYGPNPVVTSVETLGKTHQAWDIRAAYLKAWELYFPLIQEAEITSAWLGLLDVGSPLSARLDTTEFDLVISSIPAKDLCMKGRGHRFLSQDVWAIGDAPERGIYAPFRPAPGTVMCDGTDERGWYRASNVFGYSTVEWPHHTKPPLPGIARVLKPIGTDCDCFERPEDRRNYDFIRVGRYGRWDKSTLSHHAYTQVASL